MAFKRKRSTRVKRSKRKGAARARTARVSRANLVRTIKRVTMKTAESKSRTNTISKQELYHNSFGSLLNNIFASPGIIKINAPDFMPPQGVKDNERVGDQINLAGFKIKLLFGQKADRPNVTFRLMCLKIPKGSSVTYGSWFTATTNNILLDDPNNDFVKVLYSTTMRPNEAGLANVGGDEYTFVKRLWIPYKKLLKFGPADASTTHNDDDIYLVIMCYDAFGTLTTDNIAYCQAITEVFYRDP